MVVKVTYKTDQVMVVKVTHETNQVMVVKVTRSDDAQASFIDRIAPSVVCRHAHALSHTTRR